MKIKEFEALNLKECLQQVRQEMGPEAVILETRKFRKGGVMGWGAKDAVKIVAATGVSVQDPPAVKQNRQATAVSGGRQEQKPVANSEHILNAAAALTSMSTASTTSTASAAPSGSTGDTEKLKRLEREMTELRNGIAAIRQAVVSGPAPTAAQAPVFQPLAPAQMASHSEALLHPDLFRRLLVAEIPEELTLDLLRSLPDLSAWNSQARAPLAESALRDVMASRIQSTGPIRLQAGKTRVVALVGPTGVGKTTTIAKLAATYALVEKKKVGLITMDTYRIAAVEQLKTYGQIIDIPIRVAYTSAEIAPALESFAGFDIVLIDTAGRSQKNLMQVSELKSLVDTAGCETHLVLAASTKEKDLLDQVARFRESGVDRILFTKLDETTTYGTMYTIAAKTGIPVSYLTTGQKVPEDIEPADGARLASLVLDSTPAH
jgi:flagellar biosynthesis protein FlhF